MNKQKKHRLRSVIYMLLSAVMVIVSCNISVFAAETATQGLWTITNDGSSGTATYGDIGFTYYSPKTIMVSGSSGGKDYVRSNATNGSAWNGIVLTEGYSYCDFKPINDGTLTVYVGNANTKDGYISRTSETGAEEPVAHFVPGGTDNYDTAGFKVTQGAAWATLDIEVEKGYTYYISLVGSKMLCYGAEYTAYTNVQGYINDSFNLGNYEIKFTNKTTGESKTADVTGNEYSILLKPGYEYSASLTGENAMQYAFTNDSSIINVEKAETQKADLTIEKSMSYMLSGSIEGLAEDYAASDMKLVFVPNDTISQDSVTAEIDLAKRTYNAQLVANVKYELTLEGAYDYRLSEAVIIDGYSTNTELNISLSAVEKYAVRGKFLGLTQIRGEYETLNVKPESIKFKNVADGYEYSGNVSDGAYSANLRNGSYEASITSANYSTSTHVVVNNGEVTRDLLLKDISNKTIAYKDTLYVGKDKEYKSVQSAVDAAASMTRTDGQEVTIKIDPGVYREQVVVKVPYITLESNGGTRDNTTITWYYGIGYKYYSSVNSYYDPYADYDKFEKGNIEKYWGAAVIVERNATGFKAENIKFENSFNKYMTEEELSDGVELNGLESITTVRKENTNVETRAATERASALVNYADRIEFNNCSFIGSQDTLYTSNVTNDSYYRNCYIEGQTDFIFGNGDVIFDGCEINFCGYDGTYAPGGYITANSTSAQYPTDDGYIFRSCYISYNNERSTSSGMFGRMWGDSAKVSFINTQLQEADMIDGPGWSSMTVAPDAPTVQLTEYNTIHNGVKVDTSKRVNGVKDSVNLEDYSVENVFINKGWTPSYYINDEKGVPEFSSAPTMTSNGDLNTPNPGETITIGYSLGEGFENGDASIISWYGVSEGYDDSSLENILKNATLLKAESAVRTNKFQIPMECQGKYIMAVVTPVTYFGNIGKAAYIIDKEKPVSSTWSDPDNPGSIEPGSGINIYLAGDSTVKDYSAAGIYNGGKILNEGSWGEFLQNFFDESFVTVNNYAQGGRSSRSFLNEGKLDTIISQIKDGDYLLMQFGHNDCSNGASYYEERFAPLYTKDNPYDGNTYPTIVPTEDMKVDTPAALKGSYGDKYYSWDCGATYKGYLQFYIDKALEKGAIPVIVSPVARLYYNSDGSIRPHHDANMTDYAGTMDYRTTNNAYVTACEELYNENKDKGVLYIDAYGMTEEIYVNAYKDGGNTSTNGDAVMSAGDKTHSNKTGGVIQAGLLAKWIKDANVSLSGYVVQPETVYGENADGNYIFTIKNSVFTANDNKYNKSDYWTLFGQELFDSIGAAKEENRTELEAVQKIDNSKSDLLINGYGIPENEITDDTVFARVIGSLDSKDNAELEKIHSVGFTFVNADEVDKYESDNNSDYNPAMETEIKKVSTVVDTVYDSIYDINSYDENAVVGGKYIGATDSSANDPNKSYFEVVAYGNSNTRVYAYVFTQYAEDSAPVYSDKDNRKEIDFSILN